jgi:phospholipase/lecithinase/hemolysin
MTIRPFVALFVAIFMTVGWGRTSGADEHSFTLYVFGDSLSDDGNFFDLTGGLAPPSPPYYNGRFSNGPVWVEYLNRMLPNASLHNMAVGGAFTDIRNENGLGGGVQDQVDAFLVSEPMVESNDLVILWAGANNYFGGDTDPIAVVADIADAITDLTFVAGAERFLVVNLPKLGETPAGAASGFGEQLNLLTNGHNLVLAQAVNQLRDVLGIQIVLLDVNPLFDRALADTFGFRNTDDPCLTLMPFSICSKPKKYLFWDPVHPTTTAHFQIAVLAMGALSAAQASQVAAAE